MDIDSASETRLQRSIFHRTWSAWKDLQQTFSQSGDEKLQKRSRRLADCCCRGGLYISSDEPHTTQLWISRCGDRLCPICSGIRARKVRRQLEVVVKHSPVCRHMILTLQSEPGNDLSEAIRHLQASFRKLRTFDSWEDKVYGGAYVIEIKRNRKENSWHVHLHILYSGYFWAQRHLSACWEDASRGSTIVWITRAGRSHAAYLSKYCGKPTDFAQWTAPEVVKYAIATQGIRMVQTFGKLHRLPLSEKCHQDRPKGTGRFLPLRSLCDLVASGNPAASNTLRVLVDRWPGLRGLGHGLIDLPPPNDPTYPRSDSDRWTEALDHVSKFLYENAESLGMVLGDNKGKMSFECNNKVQKSTPKRTGTLPGMELRHV